MPKGITITPSITDRSDNALRTFFKEISKIPMISSDEEIELANKIAVGDQEALNKLVSANLTFVVSVAKQYQNRGLPLLDLIQEGTIGLINGAKKFSPDKGVKFISYAVWWIRQAIVLALSAQSRTIRVPMNQVLSIGKIKKESEKFEQENYRLPSSEELAERINTETSKVDQSIIAFNKSVSLDTPLKNDETSSLLDIVKNENVDDTDKDLDSQSITKEIRYILSKLSYREQDVLRMFYGIEMDSMQKEEIADRFGITCERVRQIRNGALDRIKRKYSDVLKDLL